MGDWGFDDFKAYLKFQLGQRTDLEAAGDAAENLYGVWINLSYRELTGSTKLLGQELNFTFPQIETDTTKDTSDGVAYVDVPTGLVYVEDIYDETSNRWLEPIPHREYVQNTDRADTNAESEPTEWVRRGTYIYLHPTPDAIYSLRIYSRNIVSNLTGTGATVIGAEWDEVILQLALIKALRWTKEYEIIQTEAEALKVLLQQQQGLYQREELGRDPIIRPSLTYTRRGQGYKK